MTTLKEQGLIFDAELERRGVKKYPYARILIRRRKEYIHDTSSDNMVTIEVDAKPCPFCGQDPVVTIAELLPRADYHVAGSRIYCPNCGLEHWHSLPLDENIKRWNRRTG